MYCRVEYPSSVRKHEVSTHGYAITEEEGKAVKSGLKAMPFLTIFKDDYAERLKAFIANPSDFKERPIVVKSDFSLEAMFKANEGDKKLMEVKKK